MIKILTEADNQQTEKKNTTKPHPLSLKDIIESYKSTDSPYHKLELIQDLYKECNINEIQWKKFCKVNLSSLITEFDYYGFQNNPFMNFILVYYSVNSKMLAPFDSEKTTYNILHNSVSRGIIPENSLRFKDKNFQILKNKNLWTLDASSVSWLIDAWSDWNPTTMLSNNEIRNQDIINLFEPRQNEKSKDTTQVQGYKLTENDIIALRTAVFFSDIDFTNLGNVRSNYKLISSFSSKATNCEISGHFLPISLIAKNIEIVTDRSRTDKKEDEKMPTDDAEEILKDETVKDGLIKLKKNVRNKDEWKAFLRRIESAFDYIS